MVLVEVAICNGISWDWVCLARRWVGVISRPQWQDLTGVLLSEISIICSFWLVLPLEFLYWWSLPFIRCLCLIGVSGLESFLPPPCFSRIGISIYLLSMRQRCIWRGERDYWRIDILIVLCLVCGILPSILGVVLWCSHSYRDSLEPEYVCILGCHRVIRF